MKVSVAGRGDVGGDDADDVGVHGVCHGDVCEGGAGQEAVELVLVEHNATYFHALVSVGSSA